MNRWIDVGIGDWFYNAVIDASNLKLEDGTYWITGMTYNIYESGKPYIYHEVISGASQVSYVLPTVIIPSNDNPLSVFVDGVRVLYKEVQPNVPVAQTTVILYVAPKQGSVVSFVSWGKPVVDADGRPFTTTSYPNYPSAFVSGSYQYLPYFNKTQEYVVVFGRKLRRLSFPYNPSQDIHSQLNQYMGVSTEYYWISPNGVLYVPYIFNGVSCTVTYWDRSTGFRETKVVKPISSEIVFNNRFFPDAKMLRSEFFVLLSRLRRYLYSRFTDLEAPKGGVNQTFITYLGQNVFRLNGYFKTNGLSVYVEGVRVTQGFKVYPIEHYVVFDEPFPEDVEVTFKWNKTSSRFSDVVGNEWWAPFVLEMEDDMVDGQYVINSVGGGFSADSFITRKDAVAVLNRFRKWCLERFV